jgi:hypothetical protein
MDKQLNYGRRTMLELREDLFGYIQQYYPDLISDFNDSSVGALLIDLCAGVGDVLSFNTDRNFHETQLGSAQQRKSVLGIAQTLGLKIPGRKSSATIVDFSIIVPANGDSFSTDYLPLLRSGAQISGSGKTFETVEEIDFNSGFSASGLPNRIVIPQQNNIGQIVSYVLTKREMVYNGLTKTYKTTISASQAKPFMELVIPDSEVVSVTDVVVVPGLTTNAPEPNDPALEANRFYEAESLAQATLFRETAGGESADYIKAGSWQKIPKRFITEYTDKGFCKLTFGSGNGDENTLNDYAASGNYSQLERYLENGSLGQAVGANSTVIVFYRSGGGIKSNVGSNVLTTIQKADMHFSGVNSLPVVEDTVRRSLKATNPIPAFGGKDGLDTEEIRHLIAYNFSAQNRCVTLPDYLSRTMLMPGKFGAPFKVTAFKEFNKVVISILGLDETGKLTNTSTSLLKTNVANYLSKYRMVNDYVEVRDGRIYNLGYDFDVLIEDTAQPNDIINKVVQETADFHNIYKARMNDDLLLGRLIQRINRINGVIDTSTYKVYNKLNGNYSSNRVPMAFSDERAGLIYAPELIIHNSKDGIFEIKDPLRDVRVTVKKVKQQSSNDY